MKNSYLVIANGSTSEWINEDVKLQEEMNRLEKAGIVTGVKIQKFVGMKLQAANVYDYNGMEWENRAHKPKTETVHFAVGNIYCMQFIGDSDLKPKWICVKLTPKTATFEKFKNPSESITRKIKTYAGIDYIVNGSYSMAPSIHADKVVG